MSYNQYLGARPPPINGGENLEYAQINNIRFIGVNNGPMSFFGVDPSVQQEPPNPTVNVTLESLNTQLQDVITSLKNYGLLASTTITPTTGRTVTFINNSTMSTSATIYLTVGAPNPEPPTLIATLPIGGTYSWAIPGVLNWSGNFQFWKVGSGPAPGASLIELGTDQQWKGIVGLRDTFDISNVPPAIPPDLNNGPRSACVAYAAAQGFSTQQSRGYSCGLTLIPPAQDPDQPIMPRQTVTSNVATGDSAESIGYPNDTAYPKQQTIEATGNYIVQIVDVCDIDI